MERVQEVLQGHDVDATSRREKYGTEASPLAEVGIFVVMIGVGDIVQAYTKGEGIELSQLESGVAV